MGSILSASLTVVPAKNAHAWETRASRKHNHVGSCGFNPDHIVGEQDLPQVGGKRPTSKPPRLFSKSRPIVVSSLVGAPQTHYGGAVCRPCSTAIAGNHPGSARVCGQHLQHRRDQVVGGYAGRLDASAGVDVRHTRLYGGPFQRGAPQSLLQHAQRGRWQHSEVA
jgi:hypothetical protein